MTAPPLAYSLYLDRDARPAAGAPIFVVIRSDDERLRERASGYGNTANWPSAVEWAYWQQHGRLPPGSATRYAAIVDGGSAMSLAARIPEAEAALWALAEAGPGLELDRAVTLLRRAMREGETIS